ncbi:M23 family metallopeptidase [Bacteroidota bacterium]
MFGYFESILTNITLGISLIMFFVFVLRIRYLKKHLNQRIKIWDVQIPLLFALSKIVLAVSLVMLIPGILYNLFVVLLPSCVIRDYAKIIFIILFCLWLSFEVILSLSIQDNLFKGSLKRIIPYFFIVLITIGANTFLYPNIITSMPFPPVEECVILDLPIKGTWLVGHAGASELTNPHTSNKYAIDFLKLGDDNRFYKGNEESVWDFYSFDSPVYSPVTGRVTEIVNHLESDSLGIPDRENLGGNYIVIDAGNNKFVYMAHLRKNSIVAKVGQDVESGEYIARIGNSGNTTFPHLHIHVQNKPVAERTGRITYPFRFRKIERLRILFWMEVENAYLLRNDRVRI